ncbi:MAG: GYD domain-containing protein [Deltaproteobacteria bacterium]
MATFFMFGKYTPEARREISVKRTQQAVEAIKKLGGEVMAMHALLGPYDLLFCITLPAIEDAIKASLALSTLTGISFTTCPAVTVEAFDEMAISAA